MLKLLFYRQSAVYEAFGPFGQNQTVRLSDLFSELRHGGLKNDPKLAPTGGFAGRDGQLSESCSHRITRDRWYWLTHYNSGINVAVVEPEGIGRSEPERREQERLLTSGRPGTQLPSLQMGNSNGGIRAPSLSVFSWNSRRVLHSLPR